MVLAENSMDPWLTGTGESRVLVEEAELQLEVEDLRPKETVRVSFQLPSSAITIEAHGTVVWVKEDRQGIQFTHMSDQNKEEIRTFIRQVEKS